MQQSESNEYKRMLYGVFGGVALCTVLRVWKMAGIRQTSSGVSWVEYLSIIV
jgi:hypothetical protein